MIYPFSLKRRRENDHTILHNKRIFYIIFAKLLHWRLATKRTLSLIVKSIYYVSHPVNSESGLKQSLRKLPKSDRINDNIISCLILVMSITAYVPEVWQRVRSYCQNLNFFPSVPPATDNHQLRNERLSTILFISLLIGSLTILLLYTSLVDVTQSIIIKSPSFPDYAQLYLDHTQTLTCACTKISISYEKFLHVQYTLHQVCTSVFVTQYWIDSLVPLHEKWWMVNPDFRVVGLPAFQGLSAFCALVNQTILSRLIQFYSTQYVTASLSPSNVFQSQIKSFVSQFISTTTEDFLLSLGTIRKTTQTNNLLSGLLTNYFFLIFKDDVYTSTSPRLYGDCSCRLSAACFYQSTVLDYPNSTVLLSIPGFYFGCYVIESLLRSSLQCFFDQTCIDQLRLYMLSNSSANITALDKSLSSRFSDNSTIGEVLSQLMVEEWNSSIVYESYYNECRPSQCTYTRTTKNSPLYIVTTLIGVVGGLWTVLRLAVPCVVSFISFVIRCWRMRHVVVLPIIQT